MKPKILIRIAAGCLLFFATGHSVGHIMRHQVTEPKAKEVLQIMSENKFDRFGEKRSYDEYYTGMSLNLILTLVGLAAVLWMTSGVATHDKKIAVRLLIPITLVVAGFSITGFLYFFSVPAFTCLIGAILNTLAIFQLNKPGT